MCLRIFLTISMFISMIICSDVNQLNRDITCNVHTDQIDDSLFVLEITAENEQDKIYYLWSSYKLPSVIVSRTTKDTILKNIDFVKLKDFKSDAIKFSKKPLSSTGFTLSEIWQNVYYSDTSEVNEISGVVPLNLESFRWRNISNSSVSCSDQFALINFISSGDAETFSRGGTFEIEFSVAGKEKSASEYPHLIYTGNSTQLKVVFNELYSNSSRVRYAVEMSVFACIDNESSRDECEAVKTRSVSDEFSPGIFTDITLLPPHSEDSYLSWRPVAYTSTEPSVVNSTDASITSKCSKTMISDPRSIAELFFSNQINSSASAFNMTFGSVGDGFYPKTKYTMWSLMIGVGNSIGFSLSITAIIITSIGIGAIVLFILSGTLFISVQKCCKKDDELLTNIN